MPPSTKDEILDLTSKTQSTRISNMIDIIDIRRTRIQMSLKNDILSMLKPERGPKAMPTLLLYDEKGLQLFEEVPKPETRIFSLLTEYRLRTYPSTISQTQKSRF